MYFSPLPRYLVPVRPKYSPQHSILKHPQPSFLPQCERPSFTPVQNNWNSCKTCKFYLCRTLELNQDATVHLVADRFSYPGPKMNISIAAQTLQSLTLKIPNKNLYTKRKKYFTFPEKLPFQGPWICIVNRLCTCFWRMEAPNSRKFGYLCSTTAGHN
jgi:hypothetical protein